MILLPEPFAVPAFVIAGIMPVTLSEFYLKCFS